MSRSPSARSCARSKRLRLGGALNPTLHPTIHFGHRQRQRRAFSVDRNFSENWFSVFGSCSRVVRRAVDPYGPRGNNNMLRTLYLACRTVLPLGLLLIAIAAMGAGGAAAQQGTPEAREACTPDAMRLCSDFIPDVAKVTRCMMAKRGQLSAACRMAMAGGHRAGAYRAGGYRAARPTRHYYMRRCGYRHC
jgi:hypothetical protein